ncbi:hypothetical protein GCM10027570_10240 [Streptomonospora sediminis]
MKAVRAEKGRKRAGGPRKVFRSPPVAAGPPGAAAGECGGRWEGKWTRRGLGVRPVQPVRPMARPLSMSK